MFTEKHLCWSFFLIETSTQVFSCEYYEILKNTGITEKWDPGRLVWTRDQGLLGETLMWDPKAEI